MSTTQALRLAIKEEKVGEGPAAGAFTASNCGLAARIDATASPSPPQEPPEAEPGPAHAASTPAHMIA
jgi:hypothetical protein